MNKKEQNRLDQCQQPHGLVGVVLALKMNKGHSAMTDWGLLHVSVKPQDHILDIGCGGGRTVQKLAKMASQGKVWGVDFSDQSVAVSRRTNRKAIRAGHVEIQQGSVSDLPFTDAQFDLVTAVETHYFWPDLTADLREVFRVVKPGGKLLMIAAVYKTEMFDERNQQWIQYGNMTYLAREEFEMLFKQAGFMDVETFTHDDRGWISCLGHKPG